jgi:hypothetical protein
MAGHSNNLNFQLIEKRDDVCSVIAGPKRTWRLFTVAKSSQIESNHPIPVRESLHHRLPCQPEFRPAVQEQNRFALTCLRDVEFRSVRFDGCVFNRSHPRT